jgi:hypothetical protein
MLGGEMPQTHWINKEEMTKWSKDDGLHVYDNNPSKVSLNQICFDSINLASCKVHCGLLEPVPRDLKSGRDSPKLLNVAAWQLHNQLGSEILLRFPFVVGSRGAGFDCPDIWHSPIPVWQWDG